MRIYEVRLIMSFNVGALECYFEINTAEEFSRGDKAILDFFKVFFYLELFFILSRGIDFDIFEWVF